MFLYLYEYTKPNSDTTKCKKEEAGKGEVVTECALQF